MIYRLPTSWRPFTPANEPLAFSAATVVAEEDSFNQIISTAWSTALPASYSDDDNQKLAITVIDQEDGVGYRSPTQIVPITYQSIYSDDDHPASTSSIVAEEDSFSQNSTPFWSATLSVAYSDDDNQKLAITVIDQEDNSGLPTPTPISISFASIRADEDHPASTSSVVAEEDSFTAIATSSWFNQVRLYNNDEEGERLAPLVDDEYGSPTIRTSISIVLDARFYIDELSYITGIIIAEEDVRRDDAQACWFMANRVLTDIQEEFPGSSPSGPSAPFYATWVSGTGSKSAQWQPGGTFNGNWGIY